jgi:SAM-dependent methyltransferase
MKLRLLDLLQCTECGHAPLELRVFEKKETPLGVEATAPRCGFFCEFEKENGRKDCTACYQVEIMNGLLLCDRCSRFYPVIDGIPRFTPDWTEDHPWFSGRYGAMLPGRPQATDSSAQVREFKRAHASTKASFGFQWLKFEVTDREEDIQDFFSKTGVARGFLDGKLIMDAGCGMGRFLMVSGEAKSEVVGLDLSAAVERAYNLTEALPFVHVIQGDLMNPPLRKGIFDFIYSIGVLHHTPSTEKAFHSISRLVASGGKVSVWVYQTWVSPEQKNPLVRFYQHTQEILFDAARRITTRLPHNILHHLCYVAVPLGWIQMKVRTIPVLRILFFPLLLPYVRGHEDWRIRLLDTFDWYSPRFQWKHTYEEVFGWYEQDGFESIRKTSELPVGVTGERL